MRNIFLSVENQFLLHNKSIKYYDVSIEVVRFDMKTEFFIVIVYEQPKNIEFNSSFIKKRNVISLTLKDDFQLFFIENKEKNDE